MQTELQKKLSQHEPSPCTYTLEQAVQSDLSVKEWAKMLATQNAAASRMGLGK